MKVWASYLQAFPATRVAPGSDILRLDLLDARLSGNKPLKLAGWLDVFRQSGRRRLLSFGGVHSNHLHALAVLASVERIPLTLVVRGYESAALTSTLQDCLTLGADLQFVDRMTYARRYDVCWQQELATLQDALVIPEGGGGEPGLAGCRLLAPTAAAYDDVWLAVGSGTTAMGIAQGLAALGSRTRLVGVNAVADQGERLRHWQRDMPASCDWTLIETAELGGFARCPSRLLELIHVYDTCGLPLDPVYTARLVWAFEHFADPGRRSLLIHSGGLQGRRGYGLSWTADAAASLLAASVV